MFPDARRRIAEARSKYSIGLLLALAFPALLGSSSRAQEVAPAPWTANVVIPQARSCAINRRATVTIEQVRPGIVIRGQAATTIVEIQLRTPALGRIKALAAHARARRCGGARVFLCGFQLRAHRAGLASKEGPPDLRPLVSTACDPALLEFARYNLVRSSVFPVEGQGGQIVRLTYEHLLQADGDRVDYVLPRSESAEYRAPWKISVQIVATVPIAAVCSPSHRVRWFRLSPNGAIVPLEERASTDPGPLRLRLLRERAGMSGSFFAYHDPRVRAASSCSSPRCRRARKTRARRPELTNNGSYKNNIHDALGKLGSEEELRALATEICRTQANTETALSLIKGRHGHWSPGRKEVLAANVVREVGRYRAQHPGITVEAVEEALEDAKNQIKMTMLDLPFKPGDLQPLFPSFVRERRMPRQADRANRRDKPPLRQAVERAGGWG